MPGEHALVLHMHELLQYLNRQGATTFLTVAQHGLVGDMKSPVDVTYLADTVILLRYFEALGPRPARDLGRQEAHGRARGHDPRISDRRPRHHAGRAADRVPGRAARRADAGRRRPDLLDARRRVKRTTVSERALVLAPRGRDAAIAAAMLARGGHRGRRLRVAAGADRRARPRRRPSSSSPRRRSRPPTCAPLSRWIARPAGMVGPAVRPADQPRRRARAQSGGRPLPRRARQRHLPRAAVPSDDAGQPRALGAARAAPAVRGARAAAGAARERGALPHPVRHDGRGLLRHRVRRRRPTGR